MKGYRVGFCLPSNLRQMFARQPLLGLGRSYAEAYINGPAGERSKWARARCHFERRPRRPGRRPPVRRWPTIVGSKAGHVMTRRHDDSLSESASTFRSRPSCWSSRAYLHRRAGIRFVTIC